MMAMRPPGKGERLLRELAAEINAGIYGAPGSRFATTREFAAERGIAMKTAHAILDGLHRQGVLELRKRRFHVAGFPLPAAGRLRLGLLLSRIDTPYFATLAATLAELAQTANAELLTAASNYDLSLEREILQRFLASGVHGVLACPWGIDWNEANYRELAVPFVLIGRKLKSFTADSVLVDNQMAARQVAEHLLEIGCREFAYVGPASLQRDPRLAGFRSGLLEAGITLAEGNIFQWHDENLESDGFRRFLLRSPKRLGIFGYTDLFAARVAALCRQEQIAVPGAAAIVGFDNLPVAADNDPPLTTVGYPIRNMAKIALEVLIEKIRHHAGNHGITRYLESSLVVRASTDLPPGD